MKETIINKVARSPLITLDMKEFYFRESIFLYDIQKNLHHGYILKEKDFRSFLKNHSWKEYQDQYVAIICSVEAIIPMWAYMLLAVHLYPYARKVIFGNVIDMRRNTLF